MDTTKLMAYESRKANPSTIWILFLFLGWSYGSLGKVGTQVAFYLTAGGLGVWTLVRLVNLSKAIKTYNRTIAAQVGLTEQEMFTLNLI